MLTNTLFQTTLLGLKTTYALITVEGEIIDHMASFPAWIQYPADTLMGENIFEVIPELFGHEEEVATLGQSQHSIIRLEHINRTGQQNNPLYLTFTILAATPPTDRHLILLVTNSTIQGRHIQALTQSRNELTLARQRLAKLSYQLDYIMRHYLSPEVTDALLKGEIDLELGGEIREVTVLFADVRSFTLLSESTPPRQLVKILNEHLDIVANAITSFEGAITQFQGDNVIAVFNITGNQPNHAQNAVKAGIAIQQALEEHRSRQEGKLLQFGIGINTGMALVGNIGARQHFSYTATGDTVNLAARITDVTPGNELWISQETYQLLTEAVAGRAKPLPPINLKGKSAPSILFKVRCEKMREAQPPSPGIKTPG